MQRNCLVAIVFSIVVLIVGFACESRPLAAKETEILKITVGEPTKLSPLGYQNSSSLAVSRTGTVAAFYEQRYAPYYFYRISNDAGLTWGPELTPPRLQHGGAACVGLRDGGVIKVLASGSTARGEAESRVAPMEGEFKDGWFTLHSTLAWFDDDFRHHELAPVQVYMPDAVTTKQTQLAGVTSWPIFDKGKILQLPSGDLLAPMYGLFKGDTKSRVVLSRSSDRGHTWRYHATVAAGAQDPNPELPGQYIGSCEPSIELLPNGQMICVFRTQFSHYPGEYRPMYVCWSNDRGKTWTRPVPTKPHLMNIWPTLQVLDNGVLACIYGRPGFHVAFSLDDGHTWQDRISFSDLPVEVITGQVDGIKVGPNRLLAIGGVGPGGTQVFPITVERVKVSPARVALTGRVLDQQGNPIAAAKVELGPNRYAADDWLEDQTTIKTKSDPWKAGVPLTVGSPVLGYRSIQNQHGYPTVQTDPQGRFGFDSVKLGEYLLTVEAKGYAPQHRHTKVGPAAKPQEFRLKTGRKVRSRVLDDKGQPVPGACVVLNKWHVHTDRAGFFHWSVEAPVPQQVTLQVNKKYSEQYETLKTTVPFSQLERQPIILKRN